MANHNDRLALGAARPAVRCRARAAVTLAILAGVGIVGYDRSGHAASAEPDDSAASHAPAPPSAAAASPAAAPPASTTSGPSSAALEEARTRYHRGLRLYDEADYRAALAELLKAYELAPNFRVLYNVAQTQYQLQDYAAALTTFERYLTNGGDQLPAGRRAQVERELVELRARVAKLTVRVAQEGAEVTVDDVRVGTTPLGKPLLVSAGRRRVGVSKAGFQSVTRTLDLSGGSEPTLDVQLDPTRVVVTVTSEKPSNRAPLVAGLWIGTGALAAGAITCGALAVGAADSWKKQRDQPNVGTGEQVKARNFGIAADVLTGAAVVTGAVALFVTLKKPSHEAPKPTALAPTLLVSPTSIGVATAF